MDAHPDFRGNRWYRLHCQSYLQYQQGREGTDSYRPSIPLSLYLSITEIVSSPFTT